MPAPRAAALPAAGGMAVGQVQFGYAGTMPDAVYLNGKLWTMDPRQSEAEALAVRGGRLLAVGSNAAVLAAAEPGARRLDLRGHTVVPGFHDAHLHLLALGRARLTLNLRGCRSLAELCAKLRQFAATLPAGAWVEGVGWEPGGWPERRLPDRRDLDAAAGPHPVYLERADLHAAVANSAALHAAGITRETPHPPGGEIVRDGAGDASGLLLEDARARVRDQIPAPPPGERRRALALALHEAAAHGITSVQDYSGWESFLDLERLQAEGALPVRVRAWLDFRLPLSTLQAQRAHHAPGDAWLATGMLKAFLDGSLGSRTAALYAPYSDAGGTAGRLQYEPAELQAMARERAAAGFQLGFHAIGDRAAGQALDVFEAVAEALPEAPRPRLEHLQVIAAADLPRLRRLNVIASVQPSHWLDDCRWAEARLGAGRLAAAYPWATLLQMGLLVAFGSDAPVTDLQPGLGLFAAVARPGPDREAPALGPGETISLAKALYAYTMGGALAEGTGPDKGSLSAGKLADFVVLTHDPRSLAPSDLTRLRVGLTVAGGRVRHAAPEWHEEVEG